jgi:hypothetical protein
MSDISQIFEVADIFTFWMDILESHQGENGIRLTLTPFSKAYRLSIHFMAPTSLTFPRYRSVVERFEWRNMTFETISMGAPERLAWVSFSPE